MNKRRIIGWVCFAACMMTSIACREPSGEPKTPPNSPLPEVDRKEPDPKPGPSPLMGDAG